MKYEIDKGHDKFVFIKCNFCIHQNEDKKTCKAFPEGIPEIILDGTADHSKKLKSQKNDIVFGQRKPDKQ